MELGGQEGRSPSLQRFVVDDMMMGGGSVLIRWCQEPICINRGVSAPTIMGRGGGVAEPWQRRPSTHLLSIHVLFTVPLPDTISRQHRSELSPLGTLFDSASGHDSSRSIRNCQKFSQ